MSARLPLVIVGAGPAGMAAAIEAARAGLASVILDESPAPGGQIYRQIPDTFAYIDRAAGGRELQRGNRLRAGLSAHSSLISVRSRSAVIGIAPGPVPAVQWASECRSGELAAEQLILATGAYDRPVPFPGWTLPGVMTAGGAQSFMKTFGIRPGKRAIVAGTGPLLLVVAAQLHKAGVEVRALLEAGRPRFSAGAALRALRHPGLLRDAASYLWQLRRARIPVLLNHTVFAATGSAELESVEYGPVDSRDWTPQREHASHIDADLLVVGFGFVPSSELATLAGCEMEYRHILGGWIPRRDMHMETNQPGIYAAGDGAGVGGALVAVEEGRLAGIRAAERAGKLSAGEAASRRAGPLRRLRALLDEMSAPRAGLLELTSGDTVVCRCEEVTFASALGAVRAGAGDLQSVKLACRLGMGACQGRNCAPAMALQLAQLTGRPVEAMGRIQPRPPIKPISLGAMAHHEPAGSGEPR